MEPEKRYAIVRNARDRAHAEAFLPANYEVTWEGYEPSSSTMPREPRKVFVVEGRDAAGWTLHDYVIPRYASGLVFAEEIDLSHPVMKRVPLNRKDA